jgi:hypothetical protein
MLMQTKIKVTPVQPQMCKTCPFNPEAPEDFRALRDDLAKCALSRKSRICHSTGTAYRSILGKKGKLPPEKICRGARDLQLQVFYAFKVIEAPTDEAWAKKVNEIR